MGWVNYSTLSLFSAHSDVKMVDHSQEYVTLVNDESIIKAVLVSMSVNEKRCEQEEV